MNLQELAPYLPYNIKVIDQYGKIKTIDWRMQTYTTEFIAPANATDFVLECRSYKSATVIWDNMVFGEKGTVGLSETKVDSRFFLNSNRKSLMLSNVALGTSVEVFNSIGKRIQSGVTSSSSYDLSKLAKGMYIVRVGSISKKITL